MHDLPLIALSVRQPWAWAILYAGKRLENRTPGAVRAGQMKPMKQICLHAAKGMTREEYEDAADTINTIHARWAAVAGVLPMKCPRPDELVRGGIVGVMRVGAIIDHSTDPWWSGAGKALVLEDVTPIEPVPAAGELGYFQWAASGRELAEALPWMKSWPDRSRAQRAPQPGSLI